MVVTIQLIKVLSSPFPEIKRKIGQREKFRRTEYYQMSKFMQPKSTFKGGAKEDFRKVFCLKSQHFPDAPN